MEQQIQRFEGEMNPPALQPDAAVTGAEEQIFAKQAYQVLQNLGTARGMQPVASVVDPHTTQCETSGVSPNRIALLQHRDPGRPRAHQLIRCARPSWPRAQNYNMRLR